MSNSITMDLENLQLKYTNLLAQYKAAVYEYTTFLSREVNKPKNRPELVTIKGYAFNGTGTAAQSRSTNLQACQAECAKLPNCTGATFVSNKCSLRTGDSPILLSSNNSYAIVSKKKQLLLNMENINQKLITVNREIVNKFKMGGPIINRNIVENKNNTKKLTNNYNKLMAERNEILELLRKYETLDTSESENQIYITKNYYSYILLSILAICMLVLLYTNYSQTGQVNTSNLQYDDKYYYYILLSILAIVVLYISNVIFIIYDLLSIGLANTFNQIRLIFNTVVN